MIDPEDLVKELREEFPGRVTFVCYDDMVFLHSIDALDWRLAGSLSFQHFIHDHGTDAERERLVNMGVGYTRQMNGTKVNHVRHA
jgi:hypothetical protein